MKLNNFEVLATFKNYNLEKSEKEFVLKGLLSKMVEHVVSVSNFLTPYSVNLVRYKLQNTIAF